MQKNVNPQADALRPIAAAKEKSKTLYGNTEEIEKCFLKAKETILNMSQHEYEDWLSGLVVEHIRPGFHELCLNVEDKNRLSLMRFIVLINKKAKGTGETIPLLNISKNTIETEAGFILRNGTDAIDCTIETLIKNAKEEVLNGVLSRA